MQASVLCTQANGLGLKFLVNCQLSGSDKAKEERKISGLISLFLKASIPGTHCFVK
jgi:hypothetical protein